LSVDLSADDLREIDQASRATTAEGNHYPEHLEKMTGRQARRAHWLRGLRAFAVRLFELHR
jgi:hypothetical protein